MPTTIRETDFTFPGQTAFMRGSVRDVYTIQDRYMAMVVTDRISAFDCVLPVTIPYKGQVLAQIACHFLEATRDIIPNWLLSSPDPNVVLGYKCEPYKVEVVVRGYLTGHAWREYAAGKRELCGVQLPEHMRENEAFREPIITPSTHAAVGHDEDISRVDIISRKLIPAEQYDHIERYARLLFARGTQMAADKGLILVDTKYEFGMLDGQLVLMDEIHTPDSSRYFYADSYEHLLNTGEKQRQLSKEFVREWLIAHDFQGLSGQTIPAMPDSFLQQVSERYIELYRQLIGKPFQASEPSLERLEMHTREALTKLESH